MIVIIVSSIPQQLRGYLTRFLMEPSTGVFVGHVSARVRDSLWSKVADNIGVGKATIVYTTDNEQGFCIEYVNQDSKTIEDLDGLFAPSIVNEKPESTSKHGWSKAYRRRRYAR